jgi:peptidoglycan/LPS O-acetylase OafA/YrhL
VLANVKYRPEIDGLRALAIIPVILFHAGAGGFSGGYVGVDIFFVISGFLITSIILAEREQGEFSYLNFYIRRARRILPALFLVLAVTCVLAWLWMVPAHLKSYGRTLTAVVLFASNLWLARGAGYFDNSSENNPLLHTWSLAVEEQYYFAFPLLVCVLWRFGRRRLCIALAVLALASLALAEFGWRTQPSLNFYLLPTRAWELLMGSMAACYARARPQAAAAFPVASEWLAGAGLAFTLLPVFLFDQATPFPSVYGLVPTLGVLLLLVFATRATQVGRLLATQWLVSIGLVSYSAYLWHQPLFAFARIAWGESLSWQAYAGLIALTAGLAYLSWRYVERPFRNAGIMPPRKALICIAGVGVALLAAGTALDRKQGFPTRLGDLAAEGNAYGGTGAHFATWQRHGAADKPPAFIVYGDSHALQYLPTMTALAEREGFSFASITHPACLALPGLGNLYQGQVEAGCQAQLAELERRLNGNLLPVFLIQRWTKRLATAEGKEIGRLGESAAAEQALFAALEQLHQRIGTTRQLILVGNVPTTNLIAQGGYIACRFRGLTPCPESFPAQKGELAELMSRMRAYATSRTNLVFFDPYDALCAHGACRVADGAQSLYSDHAHLSRTGAQRVIAEMSTQGLFSSFR